MRATKKEKLGNYICKVGKYDIRQIIKSGGVSRSFGKVTQSKGSCEGRIYLGKKLIEGNLKSSTEAVKKAFDLTCKEGNQQYVDKRVVKKHNLICG
tara:strand:+ start:2000 stop:2287 length:288 start_codon:yes stop_codon:yes gene_type:complete